MPRFIGSSERVVDTGKLTIDELAGNVATKEDRISIALVRVSEATGEPWLTLQYDEWMSVLKGRMVLHHGEGLELEVVAGQTVFIAAGERFKPSFDAGTEYVPVCLPAFRPDRCAREEEADSAVSAKLQALHFGANAAADGAEAAAVAVGSDLPNPEVLYHMCQVAIWEEAKASGHAYFPPTFETDGFTHATAVPSRLLDTANHFYQDVVGDWVCLRFRRSALRRLGIATRDEQPLPVGDKAVKQDWSQSAWVCPHVVGGIPPAVVDAEFPMEREGPAYRSIPGLTDVPQRIFKLANGEEVAKFRETGRISSTLDQKDGFVHLSARNSPPVVARLFFAGCADLRLLEIDAGLLLGPVRWIVGAMGDAEPDAAARALAPTTVHFLKPDGCVHVYGEAGVGMDAVVREAPVPLGDDGVHIFPAWM